MQAVTSNAAEPTAAWAIEAFEYPEGPEMAEPRWMWGEEQDEQSASASESQVAEESAESIPSLANTQEAYEVLLAEEKQRSFDAGCERGREEGRLQERSLQAERIHALEQQHKTEMAALLQNFQDAQQRYTHDMEPEVVRLALAVSARILRREAQIDPLLLTGAVRVALGQLAASTKVRLKVPATELQLWTEAIALLPRLTTRPEIVSGEGMRLGDCVIETELGTVDLGVRAQLSEIERGFFDRPGHSSANGDSHAEIDA